MPNVDDATAAAADAVQRHYYRAAAGKVLRERHGPKGRLRPLMLPPELTSNASMASLSLLPQTLPAGAEPR